MTISIVYCGGCNPYYDRNLIANDIEKKYFGETILINQIEGADIIYFLCGCSSACILQNYMPLYTRMHVIKHTSDYTEKFTMNLKYDTNT